MTELSLKYICIEPEVGDKIFDKYYGQSDKQIRELERRDKRYSLKENKDFELHLKVCEKCQKEKNLLDRTINYIKKYGQNLKK